MGYIYLATSPSGKGYVGQTRQKTIQIRWAQHASCSRHDRGCFRLNKAIRKYGAEAFSLMECWECPNGELNEWERYFIEVFDTYSPAGYNLTTGGDGGKVYSEESRVKMSQSQREKTYDQVLPPYMYYYCENGAEGFRVRINGKFLRVMNKRMTLEEKYCEALKLRTELLAGQFDETRDRKRTDDQDLPKYVNYDKRRDGYCVRKPGCARRAFTSAKLSREEKLAQAVEYLATLHD